MKKALNDPTSNLAQQSFLSVALSRMVVIQAIKVAIIVGTILALINHGEKVLSLSLSSQDWFKVILTYLVPYSVSTWSAVATIRTKKIKESEPL